MAKQLAFDQEARDKLRGGVMKLARAVKVQDINKQVAVQPDDRLRIVKMKAETE